MAAKEKTETSSEMNPPPRPVRRLGIGSLAIFHLALGFLILIFAFYLGMTHYDRKDLTYNTDFTISETTTHLLESDLLREREEPVKIIAALRKTSPHYTRLRTLVEEYERIAGDALDIDYLDPIRDQDRALEVTNIYGEILKNQLFTDDILILDARKKGEENSTTGLRYLPVEQLLLKETDDKKQRRIVGYRDEDFLSSLLLSALEGKARTMYLISDKSDIEVNDTNSPWLVLAEALARQNIKLEFLIISETERIPDNAEGLLLVAPKYDLEKSEMAVLEEYWNRPSASIMAFMEPTGRPENLRAFFRKHGVTIRDDRVLAVKNKRTETQVQALFTAGSSINDGLANRATTFEGKISSLEVRENAVDLASQRIQCIPLIEAGPNYWGETDYTKANPTFEENSDVRGPLYLAASVLKGNANADDTADLISKMLIFSTTDFLHPDRLREEQMDFVKNSTNWLLGREELMGIGPRAIERRKLNLISSEVDLVQKIVIFYLPATFLLIGLFVWNTRRA